MGASHVENLTVQLEHITLLSSFPSSTNQIGNNSRKGSSAKINLEEQKEEGMDMEKEIRESMRRRKTSVPCSVMSEFGILTKVELPSASHVSMESNGKGVPIEGLVLSL